MEAVKDPDSRRDQTIEKLILQYQTPLLRLCYIQLRDKTLAEDAVQETFLKAYRGFTQFRGESSEKTWLTKIAVNTCRDMQRSAWFRHTDRSVTPEMLPVAADTQPDAEDYDLSMAVMQLPRKLKEVILLYYYHDMGTEEIAETLGIAQSSVSNRLRRSREKLRKLLEGRDQDA